MHPARAFAPNWADWDARRRGGSAKVGFLYGEQAAAERIARRLFRRSLELHEYAGLAGAPRGASVEIGFSGRAIYIELSDPCSGAYRGYFLLREYAHGVELFNDGFFLTNNNHRGQGFGLCLLRRQVAAAAALGVRRITLVAGRAADENGFYTWPRLGFDSPLPTRLRHVLPKELRAALTVLDVMSSEIGRRWWRRCGVPIRATFDLSPHSRSRRALANNMREKKSVAWHKKSVESPPLFLYSDAR